MENKMSLIPVSVIILTLNEEKNIEDCIGSVLGLADEIFVVDSFSTDGTLKAAEKYGVKVCQHAFENFAQQRNWAQDNLPLKNEWVFHIDADERVSRELSLELSRVFSSGPVADGFMFSRRTVFKGQWIKHGGHYPVYHLRIFKKSLGRSEERYYDQNYIVNGEVARIKGDLINIINPELESWKARHRRWAYLEAREVLFNKSRILNIGLKGNPIERRNWFRYRVYYRLPLFARALGYFFIRYILLLGFLDGVQGLFFHFMQGCWYRLLVDKEILKLSREKDGA
jgi:glycosyltransferase involved in cell wall biosynthesis